MSPNLENSELVIENKLATIKRGDVIVFDATHEDPQIKSGHKDYVKRVIAVAGDTVEHRGANLYVNEGWQRYGIGKCLLNWARQAVNEPLELKVVVANLDAQRFYDREGFVPVRKSQLVKPQNVTYRDEPQNQQVRAADDDISAFDFIMTGLYSLMTRYVDEITSINRKRRVIQAQFAEKKRTTQQMNDLLHLQTQMIYIQNSLANNHAMLDNYRTDFKKTLQDFELEHIDDVRVEVGQAEHMANLAMEVINSVSDALGNLSNRDLNWTMKVLTVYSIVLTVRDNCQWLLWRERQVATICCGTKWLVGHISHYRCLDGDCEPAVDVEWVL
ncbi:hypothetical protein Pfo_031451 [Paulownia fortunei]|nr:hypothetical protein Pfo_031451 [Paulownia fortunei]